MRVMTKSQKQRRLPGFWPGWDWVGVAEERKHLREKGWVLFDPVKPEGLGAGRGLLVEKFPGDMKSPSSSLSPCNSVIQGKAFRLTVLQFPSLLTGILTFLNSPSGNRL